MYENYCLLKEFMKDYSELFEHPIIKSFFQDQHNIELLKGTIENNKEESNEELNQLFTKFYMRYRLVSYISVLSQRYANFFDQKLKKHHDQNMLILDKPTTEDTSIIDMFPAKEDSYQLNDTLIDVITNENIIHAINDLPKKKKEILELYYINRLKIKEIANRHNDSPQNISKHKQEALKNIRRRLGL